MSDLHTTSSGESHGSVSSYIIGFVLAVILTVLAFAVVATHSLSPSGYCAGNFCSGSGSGAGSPALLPPHGWWVRAALEQHLLCVHGWICCHLHHWHPVHHEQHSSAHDVPLIRGLLRPVSGWSSCEKGRGSNSAAFFVCWGMGLGA